MLVCLLPGALVALLLAQPDAECLRERFLRALILFGAALFLSTESLSLFSLIRPAPLAIFWAAVLIAASIRAASHLRLPRLHFPRDPVILISIAGILAILTLTAIAAAFSPPNSADAMAYHMPRVVYWSEAAGVRFYPTTYYNQIMLQPFAEYAMLQTYVLSGGDRFINFVQWFASLACIVGVSLIAREFGASARGQAFAALFCATLPSGILASSGAKNDYFMAMSLVATTYFALRYTKTRCTRDALWLGAALGFALLTKATAYLFAPWILAAIILARPHRRLVAGAVVALGLAIAVNAPQYVRNYELSGSVMGFDSAQGDGIYRWRNDTFGWKQTASNILRNLSDQLGARSPAWNNAVYQLVIATHRLIRFSPDAAATTFRDSVYTAPVNANHEANASNRWHLLVLVAVLGLVIRNRERAFYAAALICAFIAFSAYLKWQAFFGRLLLPLFVLGAPLAATVAELFQSPLFPATLCLFLLNNARHPALDNWVRPLTGPQSVLRETRDDQYFSDMTQWHNKATYLKAVDLLAKSQCSTIGIDIANLQLEYPLQALLREHNPAAQFVHTGVENASARYAPPIDEPPCAVVCLDCAGDSKRLALYSNFAASETIDKFVVFTLPASRLMKSPALPPPPRPHSPSKSSAGSP